MSLVSRVRCISCVNNFPRNLYGAPFVIYLEDITAVRGLPSDPMTRLWISMP